MDQAEKAKPLLAFVEWQAAYQSPNFELSVRGPAIMAAVFNAFKPWNITLANVSAKQSPTNAGEVGIVFSLLNSKVVFNVGIGSATLVVTNPDWSSEEQLVAQIAAAGLQAVQSSTGVAIRQYVISLSMHLKPERRTVREISATFLNVKSPRILSQAIKARGFSVYAEDFSWIVDSSALQEGALFLKMVRSFDPSVAFSDMALALRADQGELLGTLKLTVD
ncbi:MAG: hypothetical protein ACLQU2_22300 [Candidatus Binataceae bacterium]